MTLILRSMLQIGLLQGSGQICDVMTIMIVIMVIIVGMIGMINFLSGMMVIKKERPKKEG